MNSKKDRMAINGGIMVDVVFQWRWSVLSKGGGRVLHKHAAITQPTVSYGFVLTLPLVSTQN